MTLLLRFGKYGIAAIVVLPFFVVVLSIGAFTSLMPSAPTATLQEYKDIAQRTFRQINWEDAYLLDYFRYHNDFSHVTPSQIQSTVDLFYYTQMVSTGKKNAKGKWILKSVKIPVSLLQVMTRLGYTQQQYDAALQLEQVANAQLPNGSAGLSNPPLPPTTIQELRFRSVNPVLLYRYVRRQGSIFTVSDIQTIIAAAHEYDVNPVLMVAITGQELDFVPANNSNASEMVLNPFDVQGSGQATPGNWATYHVSLTVSADIAAGTIARKLSFPSPAGENAILWLNDPMNPDGAYAQDSHWGYGVADIFQAITSYLDANHTVK